MIGVTGATGVVGGRTAERLAGRPLRLVVRDASRAPRIDGAEVREVPGYGDASAMREALKGVDTLFLVPASESADRVQQHLTAVDAAVDAGVGRIVYLSFVNASPESTFSLVRHHWATEQRIRERGVPFTFLRMNLYLDFLPLMADGGGVIRGPAGDGHFVPVARDDIADAAAAVLTEDGHEGATYDLTGRERFTMAEAAARIGARFEDETLEEAYASRSGYGAPDWEVEGWVTSYTAIAAGELDLVADGVQRLAGHEPRTLDDLGLSRAG